MPTRDDVYYVDPIENKKDQMFIQKIMSGGMLMLTGARASGKSTRAFRFMQLLEDYINL